MDTLPKACDWLPETCAYRRLYFGFDLPEWHPLCMNDGGAAAKQHSAVRLMLISESDINVDEWENHLIGE